jgi:hypothetical protein
LTSEKNYILTLSSNPKVKKIKKVVFF